MAEEEEFDSENYMSNHVELVNDRENQYDDLIKECVVEPDFHRAKFLFESMATTIDKCVKLKSNPDLKKKFKGACEKMEKEMKERNAQKEEGHLPTISKDDVVSIADDNLSIEGNHNQGLEEYTRKIKQQLLNELNSLESESEEYDELLNLCNQLIDFYEADKKDKLLEDFKQFKPIQYENYNLETPEKYPNFLLSLSCLPGYSDYKKYCGKNIKPIRINARMELRKALLSSVHRFDFGTMDLIEKNLIANPMFNFMTLKEITPKQKEFLFKYCWKEKKMMNYIKTLAIPKSLKSEINGVIDKIMDYLKESEFLKTKDYKNALEALKKFDAESFYGIQSLSVDRKSIHSYIRNQLQQQYFFHYKELKFDNCLEELTIDFQLAIRNKLHELQISPQLYASIEEKLLNSRIPELLQEPIHKEARQKLIRFYNTYEKIDEYVRVKDKIIPEEVKAKAELYDILLQLNYQNLQYVDIKNMVETTIKESSLPVRELALPQQRAFRDKYASSRFIKPYIQNLKIDWMQEQRKFRKSLIGIMNEAPHEVDYDTFVLIISNFLQNCELQIILDSEALNQNQKKYLREKISNSEDYKEYLRIFTRREALRVKQEFRNQLSTTFNRIEAGDNIFKYYTLYGSFEFNEKEEPIIEPMSDDFVMKNYQSRGQQIKNFQEYNPVYHEFLSHFGENFNEEKKKSERDVENAIITIFEKQNMPDIDRYRTNLINSDYDIEQIPQNMREMVKVEPSYKEFEIMKIAYEKNKKNRAATEVKKEFNSLKNHPIFLKYDPLQRSKMLSGLQKNGIDSIKQSNQILNTDKQDIIEYISKLSAYQSFVKVSEEVKKQKRGPENVLSEIKDCITQIKALKSTSSEILLNIINYNPYTEAGYQNTIKLLSIAPMKKKDFQAQIEKVKPQLEPLIIEYNGFGCQVPEIMQPGPRQPPQPPQSPDKPGKNEQPPNKEILRKEYLEILKQIDPVCNNPELIDEAVKINPFESEDSKKKYLVTLKVPVMKRKTIWPAFETHQDKILELHQNLA